MIKIYSSVSDYKTGKLDCQKPFTEYQYRLLSVAKLLFDLGFWVIPLMGKIPPPGFTMAKYHNWELTYEQFERAFHSFPDIDSLGIVGGYNKVSGLWVNCLDIDSFEVYEKLQTSSIGHLLDNTLTTITFRGLHLHYFTDFEIKRSKVLYFEGRKVGEWRGSGTYWVIPPSQFLWRDKKGCLQEYFYEYVDLSAPIRTLERVQVESLFSFFQVSIGGLPGVKNALRVKFPDIKLAAIERYFGLFGYKKLCPFHHETKQSFFFYQARDHQWRGYCHHDCQGYSLGEMGWWYLRGKKSRVKGERIILEKLSPGLYKLLNLRVLDLIRNVDGLEAFLNSELVLRIISRKRKANRPGYFRGLVWIFGLSLLPDFLLPVDILSEIIGVNFQECSVFIHKLETMGLVVRIDKRSRTIVYQSGELLKAYHIGKRNEKDRVKKVISKVELV